jgi:hypothetical protein
MEEESPSAIPKLSIDSTPLHDALQQGCKMRKCALRLPCSNGAPAALQAVIHAQQQHPRKEDLLQELEQRLS